MGEPIRVQLSRRKGFDLQAVSMALNGLPAVNVARPGQWGNPFVVTEKYKPGGKVGRSYFAVPTVADAVACYREMLASEGETADALRAALPTLRGKNLACWCKPGTPCHADVLIELANAELDGTMVRTLDLRNEFRAALSRAKGEA